MNQETLFPDGTRLTAYDTSFVPPAGKIYRLTEQGIEPGDQVQTRAIQRLIDQAAREGGGVIAVPQGRFVTGSLYFPKGVHLCLEKGAELTGSDRISDYDLKQTRIEGETCLYFTAMINAEKADGFTLFGEGTLDGNGLKSWESFWLRRQWNPDCTNKDEQRPRLVYIADSNDVTLHGVTLRNACFWTTHLYRCQRVRIMDCRMLSPDAPVPAPSTDAIDLDACADVVIRGCRMAVNDDAIALKGGKGPDADQRSENGPVERVLIEGCDFGFSHSCLTCGSEAIQCRNIIMRNCQVEGAVNLLRLKMRPDTPQHYEHILVEGVTGQVSEMLNVHGWHQFARPGIAAIPSLAENITIKNCTLTCDRMLDLELDNPTIRGRGFHLENLTIRAREGGTEPEEMMRVYEESDASGLDICLDPQQKIVKSQDIM